MSLHATNAQQNPSSTQLNLRDLHLFEFDLGDFDLHMRDKLAV